ncbi:tetratricopeptide repeat protein [Croceicoccus sp. F390]|uniref:Tetratricopeptide repeat protein n=1 Tax=Croceicoccus esteveae TaxID=3075597 RepID=A0ABU2ZFN4_9SPHN|nr:tetratricopeptide repeat protein [Croceicoccus sp. F390]MDT0575412.1 tetratricopeptide repeat protein [Croceicoccus sp. F390]
MATNGLNLDEQKAVDRFRKAVVEPSMTKLVILDFWAEWCGPCKALTPTLEKIAAEYAAKGVVLAKVNVDEDQFIAAQFQVRSIPTVYAMFQGQPVADLTTARTEQQLRAALDQILGQLPLEPGASGAIEDGAEPAGEQDLAPLLAMGEDILAGGDAERALGIFSQIVEIKPDDSAAQAGLIRSLTQAGYVDEADAALAALDPQLASDPAVMQAASALHLKRDAPDAAMLEDLRKAAVERPADMDAQMDFATAAFAAGERDTAAETLLGMIAANREWQDGAARAKLLQMFDAVGIEDPWVAGMRRRLATILFG